MPDRDLTVKELLEEFSLVSKEKDSLNEAVDKPALFNKFEVYLNKTEIEKKFKKHYPKLIPGTVEFEDEVKCYPAKTRGSMHINVFAKNNDPDDSTLTGSVIMTLENHGDKIRAYAYLNIDG